MPLTAPTTRTSRAVSFAFIDNTGDKRSVRLRIDDDATDAQINALATALGAASRANLYSITREEVFEAAPSVDAASDLEKTSVYANIVLLYKILSTGQTTNLFIPAPHVDMFNGDSDSVDTDDTLFVNVRTAATALLDGFSAISVRYTERREINSKSAL